jgi:hypothetical protein
MQVAGLVVPGALVEIEVIAARKHEARLVHWAWGNCVPKGNQE